MGLIDSPHAPVRVIVCTGACAEGPHCQGKREHALRVPAGRTTLSGTAPAPARASDAR
jgi:hypothetical protein